MVRSGLRDSPLDVYDFEDRNPKTTRARFFTLTVWFCHGRFGRNCVFAGKKREKGSNRRKLLDPRIINSYFRYGRYTNNLRSYPGTVRFYHNDLDDNAPYSYTGCQDILVYWNYWIIDCNRSLLFDFRLSDENPAPEGVVRILKGGTNNRSSS